MSEIIVKEWNGHNIRFENRDGLLWGCLTDMAQATNKLVKDYVRLESTQELIITLQNDVNHDNDNGRNIPLSQNDIINVKSGRGGGTWGIEEIVIDFAYRSNIQFRLWVIRVIQDVGRKGYHISENINTEQLESLRTEISTLKQERDRANELVYANASLKELIDKITYACNVTLPHKFPRQMTLILQQKYGVIWKTGSVDPDNEKRFYSMGSNNRDNITDWFPKAFMDTMNYYYYETEDGCIVHTMPRVKAYLFPENLKLL